MSVASFPLWHATETVMCFMSTGNDWFTRADGVIRNYSRNTVEPWAEKETTVCDAPDRKEDEDLKSLGGEQMGATSLWHTVHHKHMLTSLTSCKVENFFFLLTVLSQKLSDEVMVSV